MSVNLSQRSRNLWYGTTPPDRGELGRLLRRFGAEVVVGHPTFRNQSTIGPLLAQGIRGARTSFGGRKVAFVVSDGTLTADDPDTSTLDAARRGAAAAVQDLPEGERDRVLVVAAAYEGYGGDITPGKGSALKMIFDELGQTDATLLVLLDGDLRNDMARWQTVFGRVERAHRQRFGSRPMFVTARYARHFVDASLTRFVVGPLTTLMGTSVPGGISGDIALSAEAVAKERRAEWTPARRRYGTDISTTFDNIADPDTVIWEVYLGAKLHDITDEAKLSTMPEQVIGAALERLLHWQRADGLVLDTIRAERDLAHPETWGPDQTGIGFVDPGATDAFDVDVKVRGLIERFDEFAGDIAAVAGDELLGTLRERRRALAADGVPPAPERPLWFLGVDGSMWIDILYRAVAFTLRTGEVDRPQRCLNYLYTAAFLEFVKHRLIDLGYPTAGAVRRAQGELAVPPERAERFYAEEVDAVARGLALRFYQGRRRILEHLG